MEALAWLVVLGSDEEAGQILERIIEVAATPGGTARAKTPRGGESRADRDRWVFGGSDTDGRRRTGLDGQSSADHGPASTSARDAKAA